MYTVFLTGGLGSGKSAVCKLMRDKGARIVDLDAIAHDVLGDASVKVELARRFGSDVLRRPEGFDSDSLYGCLDEAACGEADVARAEVDRRLLARRAFASFEDTADLNAITHPPIMERLGETLAGGCSCMGSRDRVVVVEVPLIEECPEMHGFADEIVTVACPVEVRRAHCLGRGMELDDFERRNARQITDEQRIAVSTSVIVNDGTVEDLRAAVDSWWSAREGLAWKPAAKPAAPAVPAVPAPSIDSAAPADSSGPAVPGGRPAGGAAGDAADAGGAPAFPAAFANLRSPAVSFVGRHNSGKTTLVTAVISALMRRGVDVGSVKHHGHRGFEIDVPGKDSWRHREAGASEVAVCSPDKFALVRSLDRQLEADEIVAQMAPHDVVLVEGYRHSGLPSIEIMRSGNERDRVAADEFVRATGEGRRFEFDPTVLGDNADRMPDGLTIGLASDIPEALEAARGLGIEAFDLDDADAIAEFIATRVARGTGSRG